MQSRMFGGYGGDALPIPPLQKIIPLDELQPDLVRADNQDLLDAALLEGAPEPLLYLLSADGSNLVRECWAIADLLALGYDKQMVGRATGLNSSAMDRRLRLAGLNLHLRQAAESGLITNTTAELLVGLSPDIQARLARQLASEGKLTAETVKQARQAVRESQFPAGSLFSSFDDEPADNWAEEVVSHLVSALEWLPAEYEAERDLLARVLSFVQEEAWQN